MKSLTFLLSLLCTPVIAQDPVYITIDKSKGLPSNTVYDLLQDRAGFIWIAHDKGLSKYDGFQFVNYENTQQKGKSLSNLLLDKEGKIWCQNFTGQYFFVRNDSLLLCPQLAASGIYTPAAILDGNTLVAATETTIRYLNTVTLQVQEKKQTGNSVTRYTSLSKNEYLLWNKLTAQLFNTNSQGNTNMLNLPKDNSFFYVHKKKSSVYLLPKYPQREWQAWVDGEFKKMPAFQPGTFIQNVRNVDDRTMALLTTSGVYMMDDLANPVHYFSGKNTSSILQDAEGNWWVATLNEGIFFIPSLNNKRKFYDHSFTALHADTLNSTLYMGTGRNEMMVYGPTNGELKHLYTQPVNQEIIAIYYNNTARQLLFASDQLYYSEDSKLKYSSPAAVKDIKPINDFTYVLATSVCIGIFATRSDLELEHWKKTYPQQYPGSPLLMLNKASFRGRAVEVVNDTIYSATSDGLIVYTPTKSFEITWQGNPIVVSDLERYGATVYAATFNDGIFKITGGSIQKLPLKNTSYYKVKAYKEMVWALTENSLEGLNLATNTTNTIDQSDGFPVDDIHDFSILQDTLYLAGNKGLICFPTTLNTINRHTPAIILKHLFVKNRELEIFETPELSSKENDITIQYSVIAYKAGNQSKVLYNINNTGWELHDNTTRELHLPALSPGTYSIQLKAINEDGIESSSIAQVQFTINKPFYFRPWFLLLAGLSILVILFLIHGYRLKKLQYENKLQTDKLQLEQALQQSLLASIKAQMNPHFIYNALSSIQSFVYADDKKNAVHYLDNFSELTRNVLDMSNQESVLLSEEIKLLETYIALEKMRFGDSFHYSINYNKNLDVNYIRIPSMIVQPFVENAIRHGLLHRKGDKKLRIEFKSENNNLIIEIEDNGVGRKTSWELNEAKRKSRPSFSTNANQKRLTLLNASKQNTIGLRIDDLTDVLNQGIGTCVTITIPDVVS